MKGAGTSPTGPTQLPLGGPEPPPTLPEEQALPAQQGPAPQPAEHNGAGAAEPKVLEGDCLTRLAELAEQGWQADLVYMDPPFNVGGQRRARVRPGQQRQSGAVAYKDHFGSVAQFIEMLEPRLRAARECMSPRSCVWLHLSHHTVHDAKAALDRVFGIRNFQGEVIWVPGNGGRRRTGPAVTHQTLLIYSKNETLTWNTESPALREEYAATSQRMHFTEVDAEGRRYRQRVIGGKAYRYYADVGRLRGSVWSDCPAMAANTPLRRETTGYPTQKPESLLLRIVEAATPPGGAVLDPMCGSGTTLVAAARLGRRSVGIDQSPLACKIARERIAKLYAEG